MPTKISGIKKDYIKSFYTKRMILTKYLNLARYRSENNFVRLLKFKHDEQCCKKF